MRVLTGVQTDQQRERQVGLDRVVIPLSCDGFISPGRS